MKNLMKLFMLMSLMMTLAACGKNSSGDGGSGSSTNTSGIGSTGTWYNNSGDNQGFGDPVAFKNYYTARSMAANISTNTVVYHVGPNYGGSYNNFQVDFNLNFAFCIGNENIFGNDDYCSYQQGNSANDLNDIVDNGKYKVVTAASSTTNSYDLATDANSGGFIFDQRTYNSNTSIYRKMLNMDNKPTRKVVVSRANASLSNRGNIPVDMVEYFFTDGTYEAYVLGSDLPMIANPLVILEGNYGTNGNSQYPQLNYNVRGELNNIGEASLASLFANTHGIYFYSNTNSYNIYNIGTLRKN
jgi:hypothetical protein